MAVTATDTLATITEVTSAGYTREAVTIGAPSGTDPVVVANTNVVTFGPFTANPPPVGFAFLTDAASGTVGSVLARWSDTAEDAELNESLEVAIGALVLGLDTTEAAV